MSQDTIATQRQNADTGSYSPHVVGAALSLAALAIYLGTLSRHYSSDSCLYAVDVELQSWFEVILPHHLLLHPLASVWFHLWQAAGWTRHAMVPLQTLNALAGAACVGLLFWICRRASSSTAAAALAALGFAVSGGQWLLSTEAELVTVPLAVELLVLGWILHSAEHEAPTTAKLLGLGAAIGVATLMYVSSAALLPVAILSLSMSRRAAPRRLQTTTLLVAGFAVPVILGAVVVLNALTPETAERVVLRPGYGWGVLTWQNLPRGGYAFLRTLVMFPGLGMSDRTLLWQAQATLAELVAFASTYLLTALSAAVPLLVAIVRRPPIKGGAALLLWTALHVAFAFFWVPSDVSFWMQATVAWWLLVAVLVGEHASARRVVTLAVIALLLINGLGLIVPHHRALAADAVHPCDFVFQRRPATAGWAADYR